jgi:hypothetical protein
MGDPAQTRDRDQGSPGRDAIAPAAALPAQQRPVDPEMQWLDAARPREILTVGCTSSTWPAKTPYVDDGT